LLLLREIKIDNSHNRLNHFEIPAGQSKTFLVAEFAFPDRTRFVTFTSSVGYFNGPVCPTV